MLNELWDSLYFGGIFSLALWFNGYWAYVGPNLSEGATIIQHN